MDKKDNKKKKTIFKSPFHNHDWSRDVTVVKGNYEKESLKKIIELYPELFVNEDIYIDEELTTLWKKCYREKRLNKLL